MFEHFKDELLSVEKFILRVFRFFIIATTLLLFGLIPGVIGFQWLGNLDLSESLINSLSILGTVDLPYTLTTKQGAAFTAIYGLFVETIFFLSMAILLAPIVHRVFHRFHISTE